MLGAQAENFLFLIAVRFFHGVSMLMISGTSIALLVSCCVETKRGEYIGTLSACVYGGLSLGPFIGGFITAYLGWRMIFWCTGLVLAFNFCLLYTVKLNGMEINTNNLTIGVA